MFLETTWKCPKAPVMLEVSKVVDQTEICPKLSSPKSTTKGTKREERRLFSD